MKHLFLLLSITATGRILKPGYAADDPILAVKGGSVELQVQRKLTGVSVDYIVWRFNIEHPVIKYSNESKHPVKIYKEYAGRAAIVGTTYNLRLSDLSELDNGTYSARIMDHHGYEHDVAKHALVVHEAVPELDFSMTLLYFNSTEGHCNVSILCSAEDSYVSYTCDLAGCVEDQLVLLKPHLVMSVVGVDGMVACNASNLVSAKSRWEHMSSVCTEELVYQPMDLLGPTLIVLDIITPILLICLILYFLLIRPKHIGDLKTMELKSKALAAASSIELLHVHEFEEVLKDPSLPDYLKGPAVYSISKGRTPPLPKLEHKQERRHQSDPVSLVKLQNPKADELQDFQAT